MARGIVMSPNFHFLLDGTAYFKEAADPSELRKYLLYWDKIEAPYTYSVCFGSSDFDFLSQAGILTRTPTPNPRPIEIVLVDSESITLSKEAGIEVLQAHEYMFRKKSEQEPGVWSKAQMSKTLMSQNTVLRESIEIELCNAIPVPDISIPLNDILEFKLRRQDELVSFRCHLDDLYQKIISSADVPRARITEMDRLERSIRDVHKVINESGMRVLLRSMKSVVTGVEGIVGVASGIASIPFPQVSSVAVTAVATAAALTVAVQKIRHSHDTLPNEFTYLKSIHDELR